MTDPTANARPPFTETHIHLHDLHLPPLEYAWLEEGGDEHDGAILGEYGAVRAERYRAEDFLAETRFQNVERVIHVQNATGEDPVDETRWLQDAHERVGVPHAVIGYADLAASDARETIDRHREFEFFRGIRDPRYDDYLTNPSWEAGLAVLAEHELVVCDDLLCDDPPPDQAGTAAALAARHPGLTYCLDHAIFPALREEGDFDRWRERLVKMAAAPNVVIKISGLGMVDPAWTVDSLRERVLTCIEVFGIDRSFFGTNWPVDRLYSSYGDVLDAYATIISDFTESERQALFTGNAKRIFKLS